MKFHNLQSIYTLFLIIIMFSISGCGRDTAQPANENQVFVRTPRPTFALDPAAQPKPQTVTAGDTNPGVMSNDSTIQTSNDTGISASPQVGITSIPLQSASAQAVINIPLVNARSGPGTDYSLVEYVEEGQELEVVGKNIAGDWWKVCCVPDKPAWVIDDYVDLSGPIDLVPIAPELLPSPTPTNLPTSTAQPTPLPTNTPVPLLQSRPTQTPVPGLVLAGDGGSTTVKRNDDLLYTYSYKLIEREQFSESNMVRIYLYIYDATTKESLSDYRLQILQNGTEWPIYSDRSSSGPPAVTWPFQEARQRPQNFKVELPDVPPEGIWSIQLLDPNDNAVGLEAVFVLDQDEPNRELYISYTRQ